MIVIPGRKGVDKDRLHYSNPSHAKQLLNEVTTYSIENEKRILGSLNIIFSKTHKQIQSLRRLLATERVLTATNNVW